MSDTSQIIKILPQRVIKDYAVGIYARVSTNSAEQLDSLAIQVSGLTRLVAAHKTWFVADVFIDVASAKTGSTRKEFNRMIEACERNAIDIVITKSVSRFGRDTQETLEAIHRIKDAGKRIIFERDKLDSETMDSELVLSIVEACEQMENESRSYNIRWGLKHKAENGTSGLYNRPCYGYKKDKSGMLVFDDEKADVVRNIFDWYLTGSSIVGILKKLEEIGIKSPTGKDKWNKHTIETMLVNEKYYGDVAIIDSGNKDRMYLKSGCHTGIISKETFEAVQIEMAARSNVIANEDGTVQRKTTKYSSKKKKQG